MPIKRQTLKPTKRGAALVASAIAVATAGGGVYSSMTAVPDINHMPAAVIIAVDIAEEWEGYAPRVYIDRIPKKPTPTYCFGETENPDFTKTYSRDECRARLITRMYRDYYLPLTRKIGGFTAAPASLQGAATSLAYNAGVGTVVGRSQPSSIAKNITAKSYDAACRSFPKFDRSAGNEIQGLYNRRSMGDDRRVGEAEACLSGLGLKTGSER